MKDIFQNDGRVEMRNGMHFYERDVVMLDYLYTGDVMADILMDYNVPGFGLVLNHYNSQIALDEEPAKALIANFGTLSLTAYKHEFGVDKRFYEESCFLQPDKNIHHLRFLKSGYYLYVSEIINNEERRIAEVKIGDIPKFYIGIYSNPGNTVRHMDVYDGRPRFWFTNIQNTNGGRAYFEQDAFGIQRAEKDIEVEQLDITLEPGRYFFDYKSEKEDDEPADTKAFIFDSREDKIHAKDKNLLKYDKKQYGDTPYFDVTEDQKVDLLFQSKTGKVSNIAIKDDPRQDYVSTDGENFEKPGSYVVIHMDKLSKVELRGQVDAIPQKDLDEDSDYAVYQYDKQTKTLDDLVLKQKTKYNYIYVLQNKIWTLTITNTKGTTVRTETMPEKKGDMVFFRNITGFIDKFIVTDLNGVSTDILNQRTIKKYVPADIVSPIIVTGTDRQPFDLSTSYRLLDDGKYWFTNWEREVFKATDDLILNHEVNGDTNLIVYGIDEEPTADKIYHVESSETINSIDEVTTHYDRLSGDMYRVIDGLQIRFEQTVHNKYKYYIIDYLKNDSYAINLTEDRSEYEVDISTTRDVVNVLYDMTPEGQIRIYKRLDIDPNDNDYMILRKNEVE